MLPRQGRMVWLRRNVLFIILFIIINVIKLIYYELYTLSKPLLYVRVC